MIACQVQVTVVLASTLNNVSGVGGLNQTKPAQQQITIVQYARQPIRRKEKFSMYVCVKLFNYPS